ncbi:hypothetical protein SAMN05428936_102446 [Pelagibacterium halotolerans]|nr:hypothetical protein SAMN05428936_102446 [Pelagibacterium halotolerans]
MTEWRLERRGSATGSRVGTVVDFLTAALAFVRRPGRGRAQEVPDSLRVDIGLEPKESPRTWRDYR